MSKAVHEDSLQAPDGVRVVFKLSAPYVEESVRVWRNGLLRRKDLEDGFSEMGEAKIRMKEAPLIGDHLVFYYRPL